MEGQVVIVVTRGGGNMGGWDGWRSTSHGLPEPVLFWELVWLKGWAKKNYLQEAQFKESHNTEYKPASYVIPATSLSDFRHHHNTCHNYSQSTLHLWSESCTSGGGTSIWGNKFIWQHVSTKTYRWETRNLEQNSEEFWLFYSFLPQSFAKRNSPTLLMVQKSHSQPPSQTTTFWMYKTPRK